VVVASTKEGPRFGYTGEPLLSSRSGLLRLEEREASSSPGTNAGTAVTIVMTNVLLNVFCIYHDYVEEI
ncbi:hypothetical protein DRB41_26450, partial [Salmonella enterica]|nr:hypothetical protein [Salmonella enterica]